MNEEIKIGDRVIVRHSEWGTFRGIVEEKLMMDSVIIRCEETNEKRGVSLTACEVISLDERA